MSNEQQEIEISNEPQIFCEMSRKSNALSNSTYLHKISKKINTKTVKEIIC